VCGGGNTVFVLTPARSPCAFVLSFSCSLRIRDAETAGVPAAPGEEEAAGREVGLDLVWWLLLSAYIVYIGAMDLHLHVRITYPYLYLHTYNLTHHFYIYSFRDVYTTLST